MKILFASVTDSGILRVRSELIGKLLDEGHEVVVATPQDKDYALLEKMGCGFIPVVMESRGMNPLADISLFTQYRKILRAQKPDIVFLFTTKPNVYCGMACRELGIPAVMNITGMGTALGGRGPVQAVLLRLYRLACNGKNMKRIFFQNDDSRAFFENHGIGDPALYRRIPGSGVNLEKFTLQPFPEGDSVDFLFVARVMKQKGIDQYIEAAKEIRKTHPEAIFHVLGSSNEEYREILQKEHENGTIVYHGRVNNIPDFQRISQCTIQPSYYPEGMSNVILEAAASGRPVITTDHPGCREGVDDGVTGYIVPARDAAALTRAVEKFLSLTRAERSEMGRRGRQKMEREFDRKTVTQAYLESIE